MTMPSSNKIRAVIEYEDPYVQPLILSALESQLPQSSYYLVDGAEVAKDDRNDSPLLQFRSYESIDFELGVSSPNSVFNAYVIRKALIRKHFLSNTISSWVTKHPDSALARHFKPSVDFELDYAEFLDDALLEAYELHDSFSYNADKLPTQRQWWILKPSMSDRGQGIRLFSSEAELTSIFEEWEAENPDSDEDEDDDDDVGNDDDDVGNDNDNSSQTLPNGNSTITTGIMTSHLRHFLAQPYIHPPYLLPDAPYDNRKFHIRAYVVASGALRVHLYTPMLALFASAPYTPPGSTSAAALTTTHLTNTCAQPSASTASAVHLLSSLPLPHAAIHAQIYETTREMFRAAVAQPTHFQPLPQSFEIFGVDFLVDAEAVVWLLEVNAFPDFAQTGERDKDVVVGGLMEEVVREVIAPRLELTPKVKDDSGGGRLELVLDLDLRRV